MKPSVVSPERTAALELAVARRDAKLRAVLAVHHNDGDGNCEGCGFNGIEEPRYLLADCPTRRAITETKL